MPLWKHKAYSLTEDDIRYAMSMTKSNREAGKFLRIANSTYKRYASMYVDKETGKTLFELHKNQTGVGVIKGKKVYKGTTGLTAILEGKHPEYSSKNLKRRLIREGFKAEKCDTCGFEERRVTDYTVPLMLIWNDGDKSNHKLENLSLICYNCFYLTMGDVFTRRGYRIDLKGY